MLIFDDYFFILTTSGQGPDDVLCVFAWNHFITLVKHKQGWSATKSYLVSQLQ